jgi:hypothetical protein
MKESQHKIKIEDASGCLSEFSDLCVSPAVMSKLKPSSVQLAPKQIDFEVPPCYKSHGAISSPTT